MELSVIFNAITEKTVLLFSSPLNCTQIEILQEDLKKSLDENEGNKITKILRRQVRLSD